MSVGANGGVLGSVAGAPLSQTRGSEAERSAVDGAARDRQADETQRAEKNSGVGQTEQDQGASDRDADGRRQWEADNTEQAPTDPATESTAPAREPAPSKDPSGVSGTQLDLMG